MFHTGILDIMSSPEFRLNDFYVQVMQNKYGLRVVKYLVAGREAAYTYPDVLEIMKVCSAILSNSINDPFRKETAMSTARRRWPCEGRSCWKASDPRR